MKRWQDVQHSIRNCLTCRSGITVSSIRHRIEPMSNGKSCQRGRGIDGACSNAGGRQKRPLPRALTGKQGGRKRGWNLG